MPWRGKNFELFVLGLKWITWVFCVVMLCINVMKTTVGYFQYEKLKTIVETEVKNGSLEFPAIAICSSRAFINPYMEMITLADYENNTVNPSRYIIDVKFQKKLGGGSDNGVSKLETHKMVKVFSNLQILRSSSIKKMSTLILWGDALISS